MDERKRRENLETYIQDPRSELYIDALLDAIQSLVCDCDFPAPRGNKNFENFLQRYEKPSEVIEECRLNVRDFKVVKVIGRGAFGEVQLHSAKLTSHMGTLWGPLTSAPYLYHMIQKLLKGL
nr:rho-associated protein kinase 2-like [Pocillopora verrucosa]